MIIPHPSDTEHGMRRRERTYFLLLGSSSAFALLAGAWPVPLLVFASLELATSAIEWVAARNVELSYRTIRNLGSPRTDTAGGILQSAP
jgi:hypothetical protein